MKSLKNFLLLLLFASLCSAVQRHENSWKKKASVNPIILEYVGNAQGYGSVPGYSMRIEVTIDTMVGVRYEVTSFHGSKVFSHMAVFYKFSNPNQTIFYNFITRKSFVSKASSSADNATSIDVIGQEVIGKYKCTHLQQGSGSDFWMSKDVPGFTALVASLKHVDPKQLSMPFDGTILNWGGLVKMKMVDHSTNALVGEIHLQNAKIGIPIRLGTFDVPSK